MSAAKVGLGFGLLGATNTAPISDNEAEAIFAAAWELGIRRFDTAPLYGGGQSEERLGKLIAGLPRNEYFLSSKTGRFRKLGAQVVDPMGNPGDWHEYSADTTRRSVEASLIRLGTDRLDVAFIHDCDDHISEALDGALPELRRMREEGMIGKIGCGSNIAATHEALIDAADLDILMVAGRMTLLDQSAAEALLPKAQARGIAVELAAPFNSGVLAVSPDDPTARFDYNTADAEIRERARQIAAVCCGYDVTLRRAALHYPLAHPAITRIILGLVNPQGLADNLSDLQRPPPDDLWRDLAGIGVPDPRGEVL